MKLVFYSLVLNNHQANVADELWLLTNHQFCFVELANLGGDNKKGDTRNYDNCPYLLRAWASVENRHLAMELSRTADCCIFSGVQSLPFQKERLRLGLLSFDMSERWLKQGIKNLLSPIIIKLFCAYWLGKWFKKPVYKLCCSAFAAGDHDRLGMYRNKCFKWGYFTSVTSSDNVDWAFQEKERPLRLMWCARFIDWKHPELVIECAKCLRNEGYDFVLEMYGDGPLRKKVELDVKNQGLSEYVMFKGNVPNFQVYAAMKRNDIFIFTSDKNEGWGAVANESMSEGCLLIASDEIGSVPYLIKDKRNGLVFKSNNIDSLYGKIVWAIDHPYDVNLIRREAVRTMQEIWSPANAAKSLLQLIDDINCFQGTSILDGPCSKA